MAHPVINALRAVIGIVPVIPRTPILPTRVIRNHVSIDPQRLKEYCALTQLRYGNTVPLTYPFVLSFPSVMELISGFDFPFSAIGLVHLHNHIHQFFPITITDSLTITVQANQLRQHRKGLIVDIDTHIMVGQQCAWKQKTSFLHQQPTGIPPASRPPQTPHKLPPPDVLLHITSQQARHYSVISGDLNPIHTSVLAAKCFGFPTVIAHGMYAAARILAPLEGKIPPCLDYEVHFHKPILLPAHPGLYLHHHHDGWTMQLMNIRKNYPYLTASLQEHLLGHSNDHDLDSSSTCLGSSDTPQCA